ncbi:unnamed protein product [Paramecium octaurelia]|uniref:Uncharacterized protein n=1 Tax=Paramecium octaurelia TaxID=43137 RepID=A0A8S1TVX7_PAROT|nr:unnamed protein product [Paramecium octaurelia]
MRIVTIQQNFGQFLEEFLTLALKQRYILLVKLLHLNLEDDQQPNGHIAINLNRTQVQQYSIILESILKEILLSKKD